MGKSKNKIKVESGVTLRDIASDFVWRLLQAAQTLANELNIVYMQVQERESKNGQRRQNKDLNEHKLLGEWFMIESEYHCKEQEFRGVPRSRTNSMPEAVHSVMRKVKSMKEFNEKVPLVLKEYDIYHVINQQYMHWPLRWTSAFYQKYRGCTPQVKRSMLTRLIKLQMGLFDGMKVIRVGPIKYHFIAMVHVEGGQTVLFGVFPERVPQYNKHQQYYLDMPAEQFTRHGCQIWGYYQRQVIVVLDLVKSSKPMDGIFRKGKVAEYLKQAELDPDRWGCFMLHREPIEDEGDDDQIYDRRIHLILENCYRNSGAEQRLPLHLGRITLQKKTIEKMEYDGQLQRYIISDDKVVPTGESHNDFNYFRERVLNKFADAQNARWLVSFLESIPNFRLRLTDEEKDTIGQTGNVLALGRSGTGKTTCSVLRLFATEVLFKVRVRSLVKEQQQEAGKFSYEDLGMKCGLHMIFVTASPVLTIEVKRFYESLKERVKEELKKQKERKMERMRKKKFQLVAAAEAKEGKQEEKEEVKEEEELKEEKALEKSEKELDIKLDEIRQEEENLADELDLEAQMTLAPTLSTVESDDFPLFLTIRRLIFMVDGCFYHSFFVRNQKGEIIGQNSSSQWHNENKGVMLINRYFKAPKSETPVSKDLANLNEILESSSESESEEEEEEKTTSSNQNAKNGRRPLHFRKRAYQSYSIQVDYDVFVNRIWPVIRMRGRPHLTPSLVWGEIVNHIKGSPHTHTYNAGYVAEFDYLRAQAKHAPKREHSQNFNELCYEDYRDIFEIVMRYERWKVREGAFDFCDVVSHILQNILVGDLYRGPPIHFMMCDEVQDLPPATLMLLIRLGEHCFFSGDSAQTIAKGVGFRFSQLRNLFRPVQHNPRERNVELPSIHQLSINFRSHGKILDLANSLIKIIELGYPNTIDKLKREVSWVEGLKPMVLQSQLLDCLFGVLVGSEALNEDGKKENEGSGLIAKPPVEFGCDQVVIVRDQKSKHALPSILCHALCLTVYEAKGLEFDDVILYNFFANSSLTKKEWELLDILDVRQIEYTETEVKDTVGFQTKESLISKYGVKTTVQTREKDVEEIAEVVVQKEEELKKRRLEGEEEDRDLEDLLTEDEKQFHTMTEHLLEVEKKSQEYRFEQAKNLCTELKELYVACTRARKRLIMFDDDPSNRQSLARLWDKLEVVETVTKEDIYGEREESEAEEQKEKGKKYISRLAVETPKSAWKVQGVRMFRRKFYEAALHCFKKAEEPELERRSLAYVLAERASHMQTEAEDVRMEVDPRIDSKAKVSAARARAEQMGRKALEEFAEAGKIFTELGLLRQSAQCFYSARRFREAAEGFKAIEYIAQAAECEAFCGNYGEAGELYLKAGVHLKAIDMFVKEESWERVLHTIKAAKEELKENEIFTLVQKYTPMALAHLYEEMSQKDEELKAQSVSGIQEEENEDEEEEKEEVKESELQQKAEEMFKFEVHSDQGEEEVKERAEPQEEDAKKELKEEAKEGDGMSDFTLVDSVDLEVTSAVAGEAAGTHSSASFVSVHKSELESSEYTLVDAGEHLSHIDPTDEFLSMDGKSVVDEVIQKGAGSISSYSFVEDADIDAGAVGGGAIRTHRDLYAEDQMIQQFVHYISLISDDVQKLMEKHRSKEAMAQATSDSSKHTFLLDIDQIDQSFVELILNTLENFELYSFCLVICNRYELSSNIGRYVVSLAYKYSNVYEMEYAQLNHLLRHQQSQKQEEVSAIAHAAVHNVFTRIDPRYLRLKRVAEHMNDENSLGLETYRALWRFGYWKKLVYIMDVRTSLSLLATYGDEENYKKVYKLGFGAQEVLGSIEQDAKEITVFEEQALVFYFRRANLETLRSKGVESFEEKLKPFFPITSALWDAYGLWKAKTETNKSGYEEVLGIMRVVLLECIPKLNKLHRGRPMKHRYRSEVLSAWDCFTCLANFVELLRNSGLKSRRPDLMKNMLSYGECLELLQALYKVAGILTKEQKNVSRYADIALGAFGYLQLCNVLEDSWLFADDQESVLVSRESPLLAKLLTRWFGEIEMTKHRAQQHLILRYGSLVGKSQKWIDKKLKEEAEQDTALLNTEGFLRLADLEAQHILVPQKWLAELLRSQIVALARVLVTNKLKTIIVWPQSEEDLGRNELDFGTVLSQYFPVYLEESQLEAEEPQEEKKQIEEEEKEEEGGKKEESKKSAVSSVFSSAQELGCTSRAYYFAYSFYELLCRFFMQEGQTLLRHTVWNMPRMYQELQNLKERSVQARERKQLLEDLSRQEMRYANRIYSENVKFGAMSRKKKFGAQAPLGSGGTVSKTGNLTEREKVVYAGAILQRSIKIANRVSLFGANSQRLHPFSENLAIDLGQHYWAAAISALEDGALSKAYTRGFDSFVAFSSAGRTDILTDMLRTFNFKQIRYLDVERARCSHFYNTMMTLMDAAVYYAAGAWAEAASSLLQFLKVTVDLLKLKLQSVLFEKVVTMLLVSIGDGLQEGDILILEKQMHHLAGLGDRESSAIDAVEYSVALQKCIYQNPKAVGLVPRIIDFGLKVVSKQQDNIVETGSLGKLLNGLVILALNLKEVPAKKELYMCFEYAIENGYLASGVCEKIMTGIETRTLSSLRTEMLASEAKDYFFQTGSKRTLRLVRVQLKLKTPVDALGKVMDKLFLQESKMLAAHMQSARTVNRRIEVDRKLLRGMKGTLEFEIAPRLARKMREWGVERSAMHTLVLRKKNLLAVQSRLGKIRTAVSNMLFSSALPSALDVHYLLNRGNEVLRKEESMTQEIKELLNNSRAEVSWGSVREWIKVAHDSLSTWKASKFQVSKASLEHRRKILKLKWREHRIHQAQTALKRRKGRGKQDKLAQKKERLLRQRQARNEPHGLNKIKKILDQKKAS